MQPPPNALKSPAPPYSTHMRPYPVGYIRAASLRACGVSSRNSSSSPRSRNRICSCRRRRRWDRHAYVAGAAVATDMRTKEEFESKDEDVWTSTPADRVGSRPRVEILRSGSGSGGIHIRMWDEWDVDPTGASPLVGGPERVAPYSGPLLSLVGLLPPPSPVSFFRDPRLALADVHVVLAKGMRLRRVRKTSALSLRFKETQRLLKHRHTRSRDGCTIAFTFIQSSSYPSSIFPLHIAPSTSPSCDTDQSFSTDNISVSEPTATACVQLIVEELSTLHHASESNPDAFGETLNVRALTVLIKDYQTELF
ncbi:hypothetical protein B0H14DRAFT_3539320 [Mycena olivaceomarginata]|nr:hypothetical protein B0H14DRAFT_3539320 [Mycena olivaceomarginata]